MKMKKIIILCAALLALQACRPGGISYKGFSFSYPDTYSLETTKADNDARYYFLKDTEDGINFVYIEQIPDYLKLCGDTTPGNLDICQHMVLLIHDLADSYFFSQKDDVAIDKDFGFTVKTPESEAEIPTANAELRGTYDGLPFRAYFAADLWGDNMVTTLMCAFSDDVLKTQIQEIFQTYEWRAE